MNRPGPHVAVPEAVVPSGILVIDKPRGPSSHQVTAWVGKMLGGVHVGHAGTLDPQVSGVLLVMLGRAVRLAPLLLQHQKEYVCLMRLHGDTTRQRLDEVMEEFTGRIYQRPPRRSAVARNLRIRTIHSLTILDIGGTARPVQGHVRCRDLYPFPVPPYRPRPWDRSTYAGAQEDEVRCIQ